MSSPSSPLERPAIIRHVLKFAVKQYKISSLSNLLHVSQNWRDTILHYGVGTITNSLFPLTSSQKKNSKMKKTKNRRFVISFDELCAKISHQRNLLFGPQFSETKQVHEDDVNRHPQVVLGLQLVRMMIHDWKTQRKVQQSPGNHKRPSKKKNNNNNSNSEDGDSPLNPSLNPSSNRNCALGLIKRVSPYRNGSCLTTAVIMQHSDLVRLILDELDPDFEFENKIPAQKAKGQIGPLLAHSKSVYYVAVLPIFQLAIETCCKDRVADDECSLWTRTDGFKTVTYLSEYLLQVEKTKNEKDELKKERRRARREFRCNSQCQGEIRVGTLPLHDGVHFAASAPVAQFHSSKRPKKLYLKQNRMTMASGRVSSIFDEPGLCWRAGDFYAHRPLLSALTVRVTKGGPHPNSWKNWNHHEPLHHLRLVKYFLDELGCSPNQIAGCDSESPLFELAKCKSTLTTPKVFEMFLYKEEKGKTPRDPQHLKLYQADYATNSPRYSLARKFAVASRYYSRSTVGSLLFSETVDDYSTKKQRIVAESCRILFDYEDAVLPESDRAQLKSLINSLPEVIRSFNSHLLNLIIDRVEGTELMKMVQDGAIPSLIACCQEPNVELVQLLFAKKIISVDVARQNQSKILLSFLTFNPPEIVNTKLLTSLFSYERKLVEVFDYLTRDDGVGLKFHHILDEVSGETFLHKLAGRVDVNFVDHSLLKCVLTKLKAIEDSGEFKGFSVREYLNQRNSEAMSALDLCRIKYSKKKSGSADSAELVLLKHQGAV